MSVNPVSHQIMRISPDLAYEIYRRHLLLKIEAFTQCQSLITQEDLVDAFMNHKIHFFHFIYRNYDGLTESVATIAIESLIEFIAAQRGLHCFEELLENERLFLDLIAHPDFVDSFLNYPDIMMIVLNKVEQIFFLAKKYPIKIMSFLDHLSQSRESFYLLLNFLLQHTRYFSENFLVSLIPVISDQNTFDHRHTENAAAIIRKAASLNFFDVAGSVLKKTIIKMTTSQALDFIERLDIPETNLALIDLDILRLMENRYQTDSSLLTQTHVLRLSSDEMFDYYNQTVPDCSETLWREFLEGYFDSFPVGFFDGIKIKAEGPCRSALETKEILTKNFKDLLNNCQNQNRLDGIPIGKEREYYLYICKILALLTAHIKKEQAEILSHFSLLVELAKVGQVCYSGLSAKMIWVFRQIHPSMLDDEISEENEFFPSFRDYLVKQKNLVITSSFVDINIHQKNAIEQIATDYLGYHGTQEYLYDEFLRDGYFLLAAAMRIAPQRSYITFAVTAEFISRFVKVPFGPLKLVELSRDYLTHQINQGPKFLDALSQYLEGLSFPVDEMLTYDDSANIYHVSLEGVTRLLIDCGFVT